MLREKQIGHKVCLERSKLSTGYNQREANWSQGIIREKQIGHRVSLERSKLVTGNN